MVLQPLQLFLEIFSVESAAQASKKTPEPYRSVTSSPASITKSLLSKRSSQGSSSAAEFVDENEKRKEDLNLYDWLSATNSPRQHSEGEKSPMKMQPELPETPYKDNTSKGYIKHYNVGSFHKGLLDVPGIERALYQRWR